MSCYIQSFEVKKQAIKLGVKIYGFDVENTTNGVAVSHINENAHAIEVLQEGDIILSINNTPCSTQDANFVRNTLKNTDGTIHVCVRRTSSYSLWCQRDDLTTEEFAKGPMSEGKKKAKPNWKEVWTPLKRTSIKLGVKVFGFDVEDSPSGVVVSHINEFAQAIVMSLESADRIYRGLSLMIPRLEVLREGDIILSIDNTPCSTRHADFVRQLLRELDHTVNICVRRTSSYSLWCQRTDLTTEEFAKGPEQIRRKKHAERRKKCECTRLMNCGQ
ncbi:Oidioi.mRNA.OKI2018_I69.PAR.g10297.t1.cds [Oikopleura dioica]|uniref:Oidioi.mRNA.OKI2018_I69.PAR.g10297.t1.cds n=1 Tax=Oikopleura dioica TaxID=34765 RepID=A0ABN7RTJ6_OIKDI|nr:Oidioi.mRNA.OKI2018_I69.PAR.g10297.t1.cds [Oikopleura dioica]